MSHLPVIAITMGDPSGIGPEIIVKALHSPEVATICQPVVIGDRRALERATAICASPLTISEIEDIADLSAVSSGTIPLLPLSHLTDEDMVFGSPSPAAGDAVFRYICQGARLCLDGKVAAMATAPISKEAMHRAGHDYPGHTELLAELCGTDDFVMMLAGDILRVSLVTIHEAVARVPALITFEQVLKTIRITAEGISRLTGIATPPTRRTAAGSVHPCSTR